MVFVKEIFVNRIMEELKKLRMIIAGGRDFTDYSLLKKTIKEYLVSLIAQGYAITPSMIKIISGTAKGADTLGERLANECGFQVYRFPANWDKFGKSAGYIRNKEMAKFASCEDSDGVLFAFWDGKSKGTKHMIDLAHEYGVTVHVIRY